MHCKLCHNAEEYLRYCSHCRMLLCRTCYEEHVPCRAG